MQASFVHELIRICDKVCLLYIAGVLISDIDFYPGALRLTVSCQVFHKGDMQSVALRRQFKDGYEPIATAVKVSDDEIDVVVFPGNVTYRTVERRYEMLLSVTFDPFDCLELTNFSCGLLTDEDSASKTAKITSKIFAFLSNSNISY